MEQNPRHCAKPAGWSKGSCIEKPASPNQKQFFLNQSIYRIIYNVEPRKGQLCSHLGKKPCQYCCGSLLRIFVLLLTNASALFISHLNFFFFSNQNLQQISITKKVIDLRTVFQQGRQVGSRDYTVASLSQEEKSRVDLKIVSVLKFLSELPKQYGG